eukprot:6213960-Pleurochrysis_carterae.AAC.1
MGEGNARRNSRPQRAAAPPPSPAATPRSSAEPPAAAAAGEDGLDVDDAQRTTCLGLGQKPASETCSPRLPSGLLF